MTEPVQIAVIAAMPPTIVAGGALIVAIKSKAAIREVHLSVNSRLTQLLEAVSKASHAEGVVEGTKQANIKENQ